MTFIKIARSFRALNTDKTPDRNGQQYLDEKEVKAAHEKGIVWAKVGQNAEEYNAAYKEYQKSYKIESWKNITGFDSQEALKKLTEKQDSSTINCVL